MNPRTVVLVIPDGAAEALGPDASSLEQARTPVLDALAASGVGWRVRTTPPGRFPGTETGVPSLLGVAQPLARGRLEAAAARVVLDHDEGAWRLDVVDAARAPATITAEEIDRLDQAIASLGGRVLPLAGHRLLLLGPSWWGDAPPGPHQTDRPLRAFAVGPFGGVAKAARAALDDSPPDGPGRRRRAWPWGALGAAAPPGLPSVLGRDVLVVPDSPVVHGVAAVLGCEVASSLPPELPTGALVVWHLNGPDEAAHARDPAGKVAAVEAVDSVLAPLAEVDAAVVVCPDHGTDPATGGHLTDPVPAVMVDGVRSRGPARCTERALRDAPLVDGVDLLAPVLAGVPA